MVYLLIWTRNSEIANYVYTEVNSQYQFNGDIKYTELAYPHRKINISLQVQNLIVFSATSKCRIVQTNNIFLKENLWNDEDLCICKIYDSEKYPPLQMQPTESQLPVHVRQSSERNLECVNITRCYNVIQYGVASHYNKYRVYNLVCRFCGVFLGISLTLWSLSHV